MEKISSQDLSIVVQGPNIKQHTCKCLKSLRKNFPKAQIIFSTYEKENIDNLDFDILIKSTDPGATKLSETMSNNINRILVTTKAGLNKVTRKYCLKIRSDMFFENDKILLNLEQNFEKREKDFTVFKQRVLFYALWTRKHEHLVNKHFIMTPFYLSDWLCFGLSEDIKNYFDSIELTKEPEFSYYFKNIKNIRYEIYNTGITWQFSPEQYFATSFFKKYFKDAFMKSLQDFSEEKMEFSRRILANNVIVCGYKECGAYIQKKQYKTVSKYINILNGCWLDGVYRYADFLTDYKKYCDKNFEIPFYYKWGQNKDIKENISKIGKHFKKFITPFESFIKWTEQIFSIFYYSLKLIKNTIVIFCKNI